MKLKAGLITAGFFGLIFLLLYGTMFHREIMQIIGFIICGIGLLIIVCGLIYVIYDFVLDLLDN